MILIETVQGNELTLILVSIILVDAINQSQFSGCTVFVSRLCLNVKGEYRKIANKSKKNLKLSLMSSPSFPLTQPIQMSKRSK